MHYLWLFFLLFLFFVSEAVWPKKKTKNEEYTKTPHKNTIFLVTCRLRLFQFFFPLFFSYVLNHHLFQSFISVTWINPDQAILLYSLRFFFRVLRKSHRNDENKFKVHRVQQQSNKWKINNYTHTNELKIELWQYTSHENHSLVKNL